MKLNVLERLALMNMLPEKEKFATLKVIRGFKDELGFTEEELKKYEIVEEAGKGVSWNPKTDIKNQKDFVIGDTIKNIIIKELRRLEDSGELSDKYHFTLYEKFIENENK